MIISLYNGLNSITLAPPTEAVLSFLSTYTGIRAIATTNANTGIVAKNKTSIL